MGEVTGLGGLLASCFAVFTVVRGWQFVRVFVRG